MKFAVFTDSTPEWTPEETVKILAEQGWDGIEWRITDHVESATGAPGFWAGNRSTWPLTGLEENLESIPAITEEAGLEFSALGGYVPSAWAARRLVEGLDPAYVGVIHDIGNLVIEGWEEPAYGLDLLGEYLAHVHVKNCAFHLAGVDGDGTLRWEPKWVPLREGRANLPELFRALFSAGYDGWITDEDFSTLVPLAERTSGNLEYVHSAARAAGYDLG